MIETTLIIVITKTFLTYSLFYWEEKRSILIFFLVLIDSGVNDDFIDESLTGDFIHTCN